MQLYVLNHPVANQVAVLITLLGCFPFHPGARAVLSVWVAT